MGKDITTVKDVLWYKDAIIYELHIKAFFDSNGDGIGDFKGLIQKLDYLEDLGVTAIWLLPFYPSPLRDDGYDISDYYSINPSYGQLRDLKKFVKEAHKRGLKVITELVINHTSDQHPWFQRARTSPAGSKYRDYYVWSDDPNKYGDVRIIFTDTEPSNWSWDPEAEAYYWHRFFSHQPDLNFDNPLVQEEVMKIMDYWCEVGIDGFRLDAIPYLFEREGTNCENLPETHVFLKKLRAHIDAKYENKLFLAEANMWPEDSVSYFGSGDECHMNYHFPIMPRMFMALKMEDRYPIMDIIDQTPDIPDSCQWAIFLRNHDELTLEMVTDEERDYMYKVYTKDPQARINVGIRHRLAPLLENNRSKIELMNVLLFSLPGTPVIYYGDEIGMGDNFYLGDRDGVRTPMQWTADRNAGFSTANPHKLYLPVIIDPEYTYESVNVEAQQLSGSSLLWWMKRIIAMRKRYKAFGRGDIRFLSPANAKVLAFIRTYGDEQVLVVVNLSRFAQAAELDLSEHKGYTPVEVFSQNGFPEIGEVPYLLSLGPHGYYWFVMEQEHRYAEPTPLPSLRTKAWKNLFTRTNLKHIENKVLPRYLAESAWFMGRQRKLQRLEILYTLSLPGTVPPVSFNIVECSYNEGLPERYQVPLTWIGNPDSETNPNPVEKDILSRLEIDGMPGWLADAFYDQSFQEAFLEALLKNITRDVPDGRLKFRSRELPAISEADHLLPRVVEDETHHSGLEFGQQYYLKLYRRLDDTINPDLEINRYLSQHTNFEYIPAFRGFLSFEKDKRTELALALLQEKVHHQGSAWAYAQDAFVRFLEDVETRGQDELLPSLEGSIFDPASHDELPEVLGDFMGSSFPERLIQLGEITAELHQALLGNGSQEAFAPEAFSLHYQRSVFSSFQGLTRRSLDLLKKRLGALPEPLQALSGGLSEYRQDILNFFKRIYDHKIDTLKIRNHGDYHLEQVLWTGKDFIIRNFEGEAMRPHSERRLKRSGLRDVAGMMRSLAYVAQVAMQQQLPPDAYEPDPQQLQWSRAWVHYSCRLFLHGYLARVQSPGLVPASESDRRMLLEIFMMEKALYELLHELENRPEMAPLPIQGIRYLLRVSAG